MNNPTLDRLKKVNLQAAAYALISCIYKPNERFMYELEDAFTFLETSFKCYDSIISHGLEVLEGQSFKQLKAKTKEIVDKYEGFKTQRTPESLNAAKGLEKELRKWAGAESSITTTITSLNSLPSSAGDLEIIAELYTSLYCSYTKLCKSTKRLSSREYLDVDSIKRKYYTLAQLIEP